MGKDNLLNKRDYEPLSILKVGIPKEVHYSAKEKKTFTKVLNNRLVKIICQF